MASSPGLGNQPAIQRPWLEFLTRRRRESAIGFFVVAALLALIPVIFIYKHHWDYMPVSIWGAMLAFLALSAGLWQLGHERGEALSEADATRLMVLTVGGLAGLATFVLLGLALPYFDWKEVFIGGLESWRKDWWRVAIAALALFGGLILMFASLQLARGDERSNPTLRRLLYGYNAALTGLLVVAILLVVNVLTYVRLSPFKFFSTPSDWTASNIYTLSPASKNILASLNKPLKVYVLLPDSILLREVQTLMDNARGATDKLDVVYMSPDDSRRVGELLRKYQIVESEGILVVYGTEPHEEHEFINARDLVEQDSGPANRFLFQGENAFITKVSLLTEGKSRAVVYFIQGNGELDLNDSETSKPDRGLGLLKERLTKGSYDVKELRLDANSNRVPDDAAVVVIARPSLPYAEVALNALRNYLSPSEKGKKSGKLIVLFDVVVTRDNTMVTTGLEKLVSEFNIQVTNERILIVPNNLTRYPLQLPVFANPRARNPIAQAFADQPPFNFTDVRKVQQSPNPGPQGARYTVETILVTLGQGATWTETQLQADPKAAVDSMLKNEEKRKELRSRLSKTPVPVAVAVGEPKEPSPSGDPHALMRSQEQVPLLAVFGDASWVANQDMIETRNTGSYELFASTLSWLRERPDIGKKAESKERKAFVINATPDTYKRLIFLPATLLILAIVSLGAGIWLVRRR